jgi:hypothetical protein
MVQHRSIHALKMAAMACAALALSACDDATMTTPTTGSSITATARSPTSGRSSTATGADTSATGTTTIDLAGIATSAGLAYDASLDSTTSFTAPGGQAIIVLVKGPTGITADTQCPSAQCYVMRAINPGETADTYFPTAVAAAVSANAHKLVIPKSTYTFEGPTVSADATDPSTCNEQYYWNCGAHWTLGTYPGGPLVTPDSLTDLDIDFSGSTLNFTGPTTGIYIVNAARIKLENVTLDWPKLQIASLGTIVADPTNPGHQALVLDDAYPATDALTGAPVRIQAVDVWDDSTDPAVAPGRFDLSAGNLHETYFIFGNAPEPTFVGSTAAGPQTFSCSSCNFVDGPTDPNCSMFQGCANFDQFAAGTRVIVRHYTYNGFVVSMNWSNDVDLENVHILTGPGMGIAVGEASGFRGFRVADSSIKRAPGRLISTASDGINVTQFAGDVIIENNEIAYQGDDAVNVSPTSQSVVVNSVGHLGVTGSCQPQARDLALPGDALAFFDAAENYLGQANAAAANPLPCSGTSFMTLTLGCDAAAACTTMLDALTSSASFVDLTQQPVARYVVRDNYFHENRGHGTLANAPFGAVTGNTYYYNSSGTVVTDFFGALGTANVLVSENLFPAN